MKLLFLSDAHLGSLTDVENQRLEKELIRIIDFCEENHYTIFILGDLFDYWMEFPDYTPHLGKKLLNRFSSFNQSRDNPLFITGNHDYWTKDHFRKCGFDVEHEFRIIQVDDRSMFLTHGDGISNPDYGLPRPLLHRILRNSTFVSLFQFLFSGRTGNQVMKSFSELTRDNTDLNTNRLNNWAQDTLHKNTFDYIITGHDHVPRVETFSGGTYINTGAFYLHSTAAVYNNGAVKLVEWDSASMFFKPYSSQSDKLDQ